MHMALHIRDCIRDYGPTYAFWCFSFERYNGVLGQFKTNNHAISVQLMRKFIEDKNSLFNLPEELTSKTNAHAFQINQLLSLWTLRLVSTLYLIIRNNSIYRAK